MTDEEIARQREIVRRNSKIPYDRLDRAVQHFKAEFPEADRVRPGLYGGNVYVEVWRKDHAKIYPYDGE